MNSNDAYANHCQDKEDDFEMNGFEYMEEMQYINIFDDYDASSFEEQLILNNILFCRQDNQFFVFDQKSIVMDCCAINEIETTSMD